MTSKQTLGDWLEGLSEDDRQDWANEELSELTAAHVRALDIMGWKVIRKHNTKSLWPSMAEHPNANATQDELDDWAWSLVCDLQDRHTTALDITGWAIVEKENPDSRRWPFDSEVTGCACPDWCDDIAAPAPKAIERRLH